MRVGLADRVLAEAVCAWERIDPNPAIDARADELARQAEADFEHRIIVRAKSLAVASPLHEALRNVRSAIALIILSALVLALLAGAATAKAALGTVRDEPVNFFITFGATLGPQTIFLLIWIGLMVGSWRGRLGLLSSATLGGLVVRLAQFLSARLHKGPHHAAAIAAIGAVHLRSKIGKWTLGAISHSVWLVFNVGCLVVIIMLLSARQYNFVWETTILSKEQYLPLIKTIAAPPKYAGFETPDDEQINAAQWTGPTTLPGNENQLADARQAWSNLLVGSIVVYGLAPRLLLLGLCLGQRRQSRMKYRLDTTRADFLRLQPRLMPPSRRMGVLDDDVPADRSGFSSASDSKSDGLPPTRPTGSPAILGFEIALPRGAGAGAVLWPPPVHAVRWLDLGFVEGGDDQRRVLKQLAESPTQPSTIVIVCALTASPDRGAATFIRQLRQAASSPLALVLSAGQSMRQRAPGLHGISQRILDWRAVGEAATVQTDRVIELDLEYWTQASAAKLATILESVVGSFDGGRQRHIEQAFKLVASHAQQWSALPTVPAGEQAELHRQIALLYREQGHSWRDLLSAPASFGNNLADQLRSSADRVVQLLPSRLLGSPKWLAAGAVAGALGCVAAATLVAPVAIASLPIWSAIGAAVASLAPAFRHHGTHDTNGYRIHSLDEPVRAAALFVLLLELQGRGEAAITRILDRTLKDDDVIENADAIAPFLDQLRHRLDIALAQEHAR